MELQEYFAPSCCLLCVDIRDICVGASLECHKHKVRNCTPLDHLITSVLITRLHCI